MADEQHQYASRAGSAIFAGPASRFDALYSLGMVARCLTFPTRAMASHLERVIAYLAQTSDSARSFVFFALSASGTVLRRQRGGC